MQLIIMRGQISLDYLIIALISLSLVSISFIALNKIRTSADKTYDTIKFKSIAEDIFIASDELCALGNGNSRSLGLPFSVSIISNLEDKFSFLTILHENNSFSHKVNCKVSINGDFSENLKIINRNGEIISEKEP